MIGCKSGPGRRPTLLPGPRRVAIAGVGGFLLDRGFVHGGGFVLDGVSGGRRVMQPNATDGSCWPE